MAVSRWILACCVVTIACLQAVSADEPAGTGPAAETKPAQPADDAKSSDQIAALIKQLNDDRFAVREGATRNLVRIGAAAIAPLAKAAQGSQLEVTTRAFTVFEKLWKSGDVETREALRKALDELAASDHETSKARAEKMLAKLDETDEQAPIGAFGQVLPFGGNAQIQIQVQAIAGGAGNVKQIKIKNVNGVKDVEVQDGDLKVKINETPNGAIKMEVTQKNKQGKEETKKYEAKDAAELKKQHPEAHKLYDKYANNNGGIQIRAGAVPLPIQAPRIQVLPGGGIQVVPRPVVPRAKNAEKKDADKDKASKAEAGDDSADGGEKNADGADDARPGTVEKQIEELQKTIERLKEQQKSSDESK